MYVFEAEEFLKTFSAISSSRRRYRAQNTRTYGYKHFHPNIGRRGFRRKGTRRFTRRIAQHITKGIGDDMSGVVQNPDIQLDAETLQALPELEKDPKMGPVVKVLGYMANAITGLLKGDQSSDNLTAGYSPSYNYQDNYQDNDNSGNTPSGESEQYKCPECNMDVDGDADNCPYCGAEQFEPEDGSGGQVMGKSLDIATGPNLNSEVVQIEPYIAALGERFSRMLGGERYQPIAKSDPPPGEVYVLDLNDLGAEILTEMQSRLDTHAGQPSQINKNMGYTFGEAPGTQIIPAQVQAPNTTLTQNPATPPVQTAAAPPAPQVITKTEDIPAWASALIQKVEGLEQINKSVAAEVDAIGKTPRRSAITAPYHMLQKSQDGKDPQAILKALNKGIQMGLIKTEQLASYEMGTMHPQQLENILSRVAGAQQ